MLNGMRDFSLDQFITDKSIIDIGCGTLQNHYTPDKALRRVGIDTSPQMIREAAKMYPRSEYRVQSGEYIPYHDNTFDIALLLFALHHIESMKWEKILNEARRVSRNEIIILDHVQHDAPFLSFVQRTYWNTFDGGHIYRKEKDWFVILKQCGFVVKEYQRIGVMFGNICYFRLGKS